MAVAVADVVGLKDKVAQTTVSVVGVTGYVGAELVRLLARHPAVRLQQLIGRSAAGMPLGEVFPHLAPLGLTVADSLTEQADIVFLALPHHSAAEVAADILTRWPDGATRVLDMSADFRLRDHGAYLEWYGEHRAPQLQPQAVYGLPEMWRDEIARALLVAVPGCHVTAATLALAPALAAGLIEPDIVIDSKTGISGAGRAAKQNLLFSEITENMQAYALDGHRHLPEIEQNLQDVLDRGIESGRVSADTGRLRVTFLPHLTPMSRGILASCYAPLIGPMRTLFRANPTGARETLRQAYADFYADAAFTRLGHTSPATKEVYGSNYCTVYPTIDRRGTRLIALGALDNLVKGAAGQAVQCLNLMLGLPETTGLAAAPIYP